MSLKTIFFFFLFSIYFYFYLKTILSKKEFHEKIFISCFAIAFFYINFININFMLEICLSRAKECRFFFDEIIYSFKFNKKLEYYYEPFFNNVFKNFIIFYCFFLMLIIFPIFFCYLYFLIYLFIIIVGSTAFCTILSFSLTIYVINLTFI